MYEPLTIVKVRKETRVTVPAGGWVLIGSPDEPLHAQIARRAALVKDGNINDDYEKICIGRLQSVSTNTVFVTKAESEAAAKRDEETQANLTNSHIDALARQKAMVTDKAAADAKAHAEKIEKINRDNDAIRNRDAKASTPLKTAVQLDTIETKSDKK